MTLQSISNINRSDSLEDALLDIRQNVGLGIAEDLEGDSAVVVFERRYVVVSYR